LFFFCWCLKSWTNVYIKHIGITGSHYFCPWSCPSCPILQSWFGTTAFITTKASANFLLQNFVFLFLYCR
jgi:hypothetical protein